MSIGIVGLGKIGSGVAYRLLAAGHMVVGFDVDQHAQQEAAALGVVMVASLQQMAQFTNTIWLFLPAGQLIDHAIEQLMLHLPKDAVIIDGGNSKFTDSIQRAKRLQKKQIFFLDCGTSGGVAGKEHGFCLMVGGAQKAYETMHPYFAAVATSGGCAYTGQSGTGHYVKMVHNGIEYALLQSYAEGFQLLKEGTFKDLDLEKITKVWNSGSVIRSWLLQLSSEIFEQDQALTTVSGKIDQGGTGQWTVDDAKKNNVSVPALDASLEVRAWSQKTGGNYATKVIALLRRAFGGHAVGKIIK